MTITQANARAVIGRAILAKLPETDIYKVASSLRKIGIYVTLDFGLSPNRNNIAVLGGHSGGGRLGHLAKSIYQQ